MNMITDSVDDGHPAFFSVVETSLTNNADDDSLERVREKTREIV